jgi:hypothetical protein
VVSRKLVASADFAFFAKTFAPLREKYWCHAKAQRNSAKGIKMPLAGDKQKSGSKNKPTVSRPLAVNGTK